jgi:hypothetical protein
MLECMNPELKMRTRNIGALLNDMTWLHLAVPILIKIYEEWQAGRR